MYNLVGKFKILFFLLSIGSSAFADDSDVSFSKNMKWTDFEIEIKEQIKKDRANGISYLLSGGIAFTGGLVGAGVADDEIEQALYTVFQTVGVASAGYGLYKMSIGGYERDLYSILLNAPSVSDHERTMILRSYYRHKREKEKKERVIKAVTHSLIAALNIYSATQQKDDSIATALYFVGGINLLATISFSF
jgi:hypothetical protein